MTDTTTRYDREIKTPLYAQHRIAEYWLISVSDRGVEVHLDPDPYLSRYGKVRMVSEGRVTPHCFPDVAVDIQELLS
ncbi:Uma2 family endonuclease [Methylocaldum szegediense]|uniref:Uma2 family endonuclease n=1 Tax=Methylocaldum szegediense TaxID=73780 RepID=UPI000A05B3E2